jgi:hypothetical protein
MDETILFASLDPLQEARDELRGTKPGKTRQRIQDFIQVVETTKPVVAKVRWETYYIYPRPGLKRALLKARRHADLILLTAADKVYAEATLEAVGVRGLFGAVLSTRTPGLQLAPYTLGRTWSLIDDLPRYHANTRLKLKLAGQGGDGTFWPVAPWGPSRFTGLPFERALELSLPVGASRR